MESLSRSYPLLIRPKIYTTYLYSFSLIYLALIIDLFIIPICLYYSILVQYLLILDYINFSLCSKFQHIFEQFLDKYPSRKK